MTYEASNIFIALKQGMYEAKPYKYHVAARGGKVPAFC